MKCSFNSTIQILCIVSRRMKTNTTLSEHFQNHTIVETDAKSIDLTYIYMTSYCAGTGVDKLVVWPQTSQIVKCKCLLHAIKMPTLITKLDVQRCCKERQVLIIIFMHMRILFLCVKCCHMHNTCLKTEMVITSFKC